MASIQEISLQTLESKIEVKQQHLLEKKERKKEQKLMGHLWRGNWENFKLGQ